MRRLLTLAAAPVAVLAAAVARGTPQDPSPRAFAAQKSETAPGKGDAKDRADDAPPSVTRHELKLGERTLKYTATAGMMPIRDRDGTTEASLFYIAYTLDDAGERAKRPLMFSFNGGPGSSSVWLHLGALGPKRVPLPDDATFARPPFALVDNEHTWLDATDLVFIDPVGTGFSRAAKPELTKKFHGLRGDIDSVGEFIRMYLTRNGRWTSPLYLVGESYGTTRAAGLSDHLVDRGIALNGIVLVSTVLNFQTLRFGTGNDLPYVLYLPTYAATAWYHKRLPDELQDRPLRAVLDEVERWASGAYAQALERGDRLSDEEYAAVADRLARYTGLGRDYIDASNLRVEIMRFCKELLRDRKRTVGRLDSRYTGIDADAARDRPEADPSMSAIRPPYTATFAAYVREDLGYETDRPYYILGEGVGPWDWGTGGQGYPDTSAALRDAIAKNPFLRVFVASGYFDLATPYAATEYTLAHMNLAPEQRGQVATSLYEAGHMMYVHGPSLAKLKDDVARFLDETRGH
jgi:carboxypeptidase C (cathepsin A)